MYINFWYPVAKVDEVRDDEPLQIQILGLKFVAFRDSEGVARVLSDTCIHRGGALGKGWVRDGCVICPYHGWEYQGDGKWHTEIKRVDYDYESQAKYNENCWIEHGDRIAKMIRTGYFWNPDHMPH